MQISVCHRSEFSRMDSVDIGFEGRAKGKGRRSIRVTPLIQSASGVVLGRNLNKRDLPPSLLDDTE